MGRTQMVVVDITWNVTLRRSVVTSSVDYLKANLQHVPELAGWKVITRASPRVRECDVPRIADWEPCLVVEYDERWCGHGIYAGDGDTVYVPQRLIDTLGIEIAFELTTGLPATCIIQWDEDGDPLYTHDGSFWETAIVDMSLQQFVEQAFTWPLAYDTFADEHGQRVLIATEKPQVEQRRYPLTLMFSLFVPGRDHSLAQWSMTGTPDMAQVASIASHFQSTNASTHFMGRATPA